VFGHVALPLFPYVLLTNKSAEDVRQLQAATAESSKR